MSNYTKATNFTAKDATNATIYGSEHDAEFDAIAASSATKADKKVPGTANSLAGLDSNGNLRDTGITEADLATALALGTTNESAVAANTADIATNAADIATNAADIATNAADIATAEGNISTLQSNVTTLQNEYTRVTGVTVGTGGNITQALSGTVERIEVALYGLSTNGTGQPIIQLGDSATLKTSGYISRAMDSGSAVDYTNGMGLSSHSGAAGNTISGVVMLTNVGGNRWSASGNLYITGADKTCALSGFVTLAGACDIVGVDADGDSFDAGYWAVTYWRSA
jgi:hypothetical protein